jgi:hypothetical protein
LDKSAILDKVPYTYTSIPNKELYLTHSELVLYLPYTRICSQM